MNTVIGTDIHEAVRLLSSGGNVAIPTETVYGLAANALDAAAVLKIFATKQRPAFDPLIVHIPSADSLSDYASEVPPGAKELAKKFWPGPLTIVLRKKNIIPDIVTSGLDTVGLRVPDHPLTLGLLRTAGFPLAAPSANPFGFVSPTTALHVAEQFSGKIPYILDGGPCRVGIESTIVGFEGNDCVVYRLGGLPVSEIEKITGPVRMEVNVSSDPKAPGMMKSHYAPSIPLKFGQINDLLKENKDVKCAVLCLKDDFIHTSNVHTVRALSPSGDLTEAAHRLFAAMRELGSSGADLIIAQVFPEEGLGLAINDRLRRAMA